VETVALIASIVSIILAFFAIWQANHHRDQSDRLNRDTTEKLARIEAFTTSTKEDAFKELERWGDFARAGGKASEEVEKAKEDELRKLKDEIQSMTQTEINKVLQTVENKISSSTGTSTISEIKKEFEELKKEIGKIQEKGLGQIKRLEIQKKFNSFWLSLTETQRDLLTKAVIQPNISSFELERVGISPGISFIDFVERLRQEDVLDWVVRTDPGWYLIRLTPAFREFLETQKENEME
jgi:hypothetical protein